MRRATYPAHLVEMVIGDLPRGALALGLGLKLGHIVPGLFHLLRAVFHL